MPDIVGIVITLLIVGFQGVVIVGACLLLAAARRVERAVRQQIGGLDQAPTSPFDAPHNAPSQASQNDL